MEQASIHGPGERYPKTLRREFGPFFFPATYGFRPLATESLLSVVAQRSAS